MMKIEKRKEFIIWGLIALPAIYLMLLWNRIPDQVPVHWGWDGNVGRWGSRWELAAIALLLPLTVYGALLFLPGKGVEKSGGKYFQLKLTLILSLVVLAVLILHSAESQTPYIPKSIFIAIGALVAILGNYFQTIRPNHFIGIRFPWTLRSETVWRKTHKVGGRLFFIMGLLIIAMAFLVKDMRTLNGMIGPQLGLMVLCCTVYSFLLSRRKG